MPRLESRWPGAAQRLHRSSRIAADAAEMLDKDITVYVKYVGDWYLPAEERDIAKTLISQYDVDVLTLLVADARVLDEAAVLVADEPTGVVHPELDPAPLLVDQRKAVRVRIDGEPDRSSTPRHELRQIGEVGGRGVPVMPGQPRS